jgi:dTDP-4-amino-4,6-dideoxygalactose transaminase
VTSTAAERLVRLPLYPGLDDDDVDRVVAAVKSFPS